MAIYRGTGGSGDATNNATITEVTQQATSAQNSATNAATSATNAATSATTAAEAAANSGTSETNAATSATNAATSETNAATSATNAATSETNAQTAVSSALPKTGGTMTGDLELGDDVKVTFGDSDDLQIYFDGYTSFIKDATTDGPLELWSNQMYFRNGAGTKQHIRTADGSGVTLFYDGDTALTTKDYGVSVSGTLKATGDIKLYDSSYGKLKIGNDDDLQIYHDGANSYIKNVTNSLIIQNDSNDKQVIIKSDNGSGGVADYFRANGTTGEALLYHYGSSKLATSSTGIDITGTMSADNATLTGYLRGPSSFVIDPAAHGDDTGTVVVAGNLQVDGTTTTINSTTVNVDDKNVQLATGSTNKAAADGSGITVDLGTDGTTSINYDGTDDQWEFGKNVDVTGTVSAGGLELGDNVKAKFGAGDDLQIYHDGSNSIVGDFGAGDLKLQGANVVIADGSGDTQLWVQNNGKVQLAYNAATRLATTSTGIDVTGIVVADEIKVGATDKIYLDGGSNTYIQESASDDLRFFVGGQQAVRVRTSGTDILGTVTADGLVVDGDVEIKANGGNSPLAARIWNTGTSTNDDAVLGFLTQGNRNYSIGISRETGSFTVSNQDGSVASGERLTVANNGDISFYEDTGTTAKFFWDASDESTKYGDNVTAKFGDGDDLQIYHDGSASRIVDAGTGGLTLQADANVVIQNSAGTETKAEFTTDGAVNLYHNNAKKLATSSSGVDITGTASATALKVSGTEPTLFFSDTTTGHDDWKIYADWDKFNIQQYVGDATYTNRIMVDASGNVGIGNSAPTSKLDVTGTATMDGLTVDGDVGIGEDKDNFYTKLVVGDLSGADEGIQIASSTSGKGSLLFADGGGNVGGSSVPNFTQYRGWLRYDHNTDKMDIATSGTTAMVIDSSGNVDVSGTVSADGLELGDSVKAKFGSSDDLQIYHDGSNSYIQNNTGPFIISNVSDDYDVVIKSDDSTGGLVDYFRADGSTGQAKLYHYGSTKLNTTVSGVDISGTATMDGLTSNGDILLEDNSPFLNISNTGENVGGIKMYDSGGASTQYFNLTYDSGASNEVGFDTGASGEYKFSINNAEKLFIDSTGIDVTGTVTADGLVVENDTNGDTTATLNNSSSGSAAQATLYVTNGSGNADGLFAGVNGTNMTPAGGFVADGAAIGSGTGVSGGLSIMTRANADMRFYTNGHTNERMRINSDGNVGIGCSPSAPLHVDAAGKGDIYSGLIQNSTTDTDHYNVVRFMQGASGSATGYIGTGGSATSNTAFRNSFVVGTQTSSPLVVTTGDAERMRIDASGNLLVGTTSNNPTSASVNEAGQEFSTTGGVRSTVASNPAATFNRKTDDGAIALFRKDGTTVGSIGTFTGYTTVGGNTNGGLIFRNGEILPWNNATGAYSNGGIDLGDGNAKFKDLHLSGAAKTDTIANESSGTTTTSTTQTAIATFAKADYDSAKVVISAKSGTDVYSTELLIVHNGTTASATEYGQIGTGSALATFDVDISGSNVRVLATAASSTSTVFKVTKTLL